MSILALLLLMAALVIFAVRAFVAVARVHLIALGLALVCGYFLALHFTTATVGH